MQMRLVRGDAFKARPVPFSSFLSNAYNLATLHGVDISDDIHSYLIIY
jgi:hypothetical protein